MAEIPVLVPAEGAWICSDKGSLPIFQIINGFYCCYSMTNKGALKIPAPGDYVVVYDDVDCCYDGVPPVVTVKPCVAGGAGGEPVEPSDIQIQMGKISFCSPDTMTEHIIICKHVITLSTGDVVTTQEDPIDTGLPCGAECPPVTPVGLTADFEPLT